MAKLHSKNADLSGDQSINGALNCDEFIIRRWLDETWKIAVYLYGVLQCIKSGVL